MFILKFLEKIEKDLKLIKKFQEFFWSVKNDI